MIDFEQITARLRQSVVQVMPGGSGVVWDAPGCVVTNAHVVRSENVDLVDALGKRSRARVMWHDRERDLAVLQPVSSLSGPPAEIGDSDSLRVGQLVLAIGNPLGMSGAISAGVIHTVGPVARRNWIQADVRLAPGNSGGMLADARGRVIGITTMIANGLALAVPSNEIAAFVSRVHLKRTA